MAGALLAAGLVLMGPLALEKTGAWWPASADRAPPVVILDTSSIAVSVMRKAMTTDAAGAQSEGERVGRELLNVLEAYRNAGVVVLNREHVLSAPPHLDVTDAVARKLGVDLAHLEHRPLVTAPTAAARP